VPIYQADEMSAGLQLTADNSRRVSLNPDNHESTRIDTNYRKNHGCHGYHGLGSG
jgi:hypothetical protein